MFVTANPFSQYLAPLGAKYLEKKENIKNRLSFFFFFAFYREESYLGLAPILGQEKSLQSKGVLAEQAEAGR